ncbi:MAG: 2-C-methyl-D-erythritol 4-phosphate cytidylyltransferase [Candidatus Dormibacteria bacterium]
MTESAVAIIPAAGMGLRLDPGPGGKALVELAGWSLLAHVLRALEAAGAVEVAVVAGPAAQLDRLAESATAAGTGLTLILCPGGAVRQESVRLALEAAPESDLVVVHDAARPLVSPGLVTAVLAAAGVTGAATAGLPCNDTVKRVDEQGLVLETVDRDRLRLVQTPQAFRRALLVEAHARARADGVVAADDCALVERLGVAVTVVPGDATNIKVTEPADLALAAALLALRRQEVEA